MQQQPGLKSNGSIVALVLSVIALVVCVAATVFTVFQVKTAPKIGVVDNTALLSNYADAIAARQQLDVEKKRWQDNIHSLEDSAKAAFEVMRGSYDKSPLVKRQEMEKRLQRWNEELARYTRAVDDMTKQKENELLKPVIDRLNSYVKMWAGKHGFDIVIGTGNGGVILSAVEQVNLTGRILDDLNKLYGKPQQPAAPDNVKPLPTDTIKTKLPAPRSVDSSTVEGKVKK